jgi:hypothetical protein
MGAAGAVLPLFTSGLSALAQSSGGQGSSSSGQTGNVQNPAAVSNMIGNQFATSTGGAAGGPGTFNSPMRVAAQIQGANQAQGQNAINSAQTALALGNQVAQSGTPSGFTSGFQNTGSTSGTPGELGTGSGDGGDPVIT